MTSKSTDTMGIVREMRDDFVSLLTALCSVESPTDQPTSQSGVHAILREAFEDLGLEVTMIAGSGTGDHFLARSGDLGESDPVQLLMGHSDTVWPIGTLESMPIREAEGRLYGPGTLDMKGGLTQMIFALRALRELGEVPRVRPMIFINADEEIGSPDSKPHVRRLAERAARTFVLEPALGSDGHIKTARKGVGRFSIEVRGRAAHAGLDPDSGISAIHELSHVIQKLHALNDPEMGRTVNVGVIEGGTRPNVIAARARCIVDVRITSVDDGLVIEDLISALQPTNSDVTLRISGGIEVPPLERTPRNLALWEAAKTEGSAMGLSLDHALAGGGSDGNTTSQYSATLDGLGCVGDGAHADHEHIVIEPSLERCALLARLLLTPATVSTGTA